MMTPHYKEWLTALKARIQSAQIKAAVKVNTELLLLYWELGREIVEKEQMAGYGSGLIPQLSKDLSNAFPMIKGFSKANLFHIRKWFNFYSGEAEIVQQIVRHSVVLANQQDPIVSQLVRQSEKGGESYAAAFLRIPWGHHLQILYKCKDLEEAFFYLTETARYNWSRAVLVHQIESGLYKRQGKAITNFGTTLPHPQSDLARELLKDPYKFDFLSLGNEYKERDLENGLVEHITKFLLELGAGFAYVGRQYPLEVGGEDFYMDLLFYHLKLHCYVVIELKTGKFIPEYASKLNFYLNVVDDQLRNERDEPSIGIIICKERNKVVAEYALRGIAKPIGVTEYQLTETLPAELKGKLPTIEEIEEELTQNNQPN